jgi:hypothetical protein
MKAVHLKNLHQERGSSLGGLKRFSSLTDLNHLIVLLFPCLDFELRGSLGFLSEDMFFTLHSLSFCLFTFSNQFWFQSSISFLEFLIHWWQFLTVPFLINSPFETAYILWEETRKTNAFSPLSAIDVISPLICVGTPFYVDFLPPKLRCFVAESTGLVTFRIKASL